MGFLNHVLVALKHTADVKINMQALFRQEINCLAKLSSVYVVASPSDVSR